MFLCFLLLQYLFTLFRHFQLHLDLSSLTEGAFGVVEALSDDAEAFGNALFLLVELFSLHRQELIGVQFIQCLGHFPPSASYDA